MIYKILFIRYSREAFALSGGLSVSTVFTMSSKMGKNSLGTFMEDTTVEIAVSALV